MSKANQERELAKQKLTQMMLSPQAPGQEQAKKAQKPKSTAAPKSKPRPKAHSPAPKPTKAKAPSIPIPSSPPSEPSRAQKLSISLHPQDEQRIDQLEQILKAQKLITRSASTSFLIKIALAYTSQQIQRNQIHPEQIQQTVSQIKSQDKRANPQT